ncbi:major histocompatibility complex class I-related gene protein [Larimichthys crocea]|uniref:major histocompatibility complex class I-related gene protein n=1 Tax=Larimichthys crocea TaxID=215358 RepID=UPI000F5DE9B9|nr:major histocompatibility complex class I-related gene protein [Larimichthys crocea]
MKKIFLLLLFCQVSSSVDHSLKMFATGSSGVTNLPDFVLTAMVDEIPIVSCDSNKKIDPKQDWMKKLFEDHPDQFEWYTQQSFEIQPNFFRNCIETLKQLFNQSGGIHTFQMMSGYELYDEKRDVQGFIQFGYDGENFISLDLKTSTWIALIPEAVITKERWDADIVFNQYVVNVLTQIFPEWLMKYLEYGKSSLQRTELPSVSLLQKTPSSPVTCHATGFYPYRAIMFWRKDGEEFHEDVDHGDILPNHDETFQMSVDLDLSSVIPEDWRRYDCVFQLSGVKGDIVTRLNKAEIRTNWVEPSDMTLLIAAPVVVLGVVFIAVITGLIIYFKKKTGEREKWKVGLL